MSDIEKVIEEASLLADEAAKVSEKAISIAEKVINMEQQIAAISVNGAGLLVHALTVLVLACFIGYYVVWKVTPALHAPLMSVTNAISSIIVVAALLTASAPLLSVAGQLGLIAVFLASINIFGGFIVTQRMLHMFKKRDEQK